MKYLSLISIFVIYLSNVWKITAQYTEQYDYIIVGSSASGCVLANRLSANGTYQVLLLESGPPPNEMFEVPANTLYAGFTENYREYKIEKQANNVGLGLINQQMVASAGRGLGGSSAIDDSNYMRSTRYDYDHWASLGNPGWSYEEVLPYFKRFENTMIKHFNESQRGTEGPLVVQEVNYRSLAGKIYIDAVRETGKNFTEDYNNGEPYGIGYLQTMTKNGRKESGESVYLRPVYGRKNLKVRANAHVTKILVDPATKTAEGVVYEKDNIKHKVFARKEVILCAGTLGSPHLLMLSGLGPSEVLEPLGIDTIVDSAVGETLHDHVLFPGLVFEVNQSISTEYAYILHPERYVEWDLYGTGPLSVPVSYYDADGFIKTPASDPSVEAADIRVPFISRTFTIDRGLNWRNVYKFSDATYNKIWKPLEGKHVFMIEAGLTRPLSHGYLRVASKDPYDPPIIYGDYLQDQDDTDINTLLAGIREIQEIMKAAAFQKYGIKQVLTPVDDCEEYVPDSDEFWKCQLRHIATNGWHLVSTCKMGFDRYGVVDNKLRFRGARNLRVADASVIPTSLTGELTATVYMLGEKAADLILADK